MNGRNKLDNIAYFVPLSVIKKTNSHVSGLYYKPMTIVNDDSRVINKLEASLNDNIIVVIYDCHMFIVQAKCPMLKNFFVRNVLIFVIS